MKVSERSQKLFDSMPQHLNMLGETAKKIKRSKVNLQFETVLTYVNSCLMTGIQEKNALFSLAIDKLCISFEKDNFATTDQDHKRYDKQLSENGAAFLSAQFVFDASKYKQHIQDVYGKQRKILFPPAGEPCITIIQKQIQQLSRPKSGITSPKIKEFYSARQANLRCSLNLCIEAQCKALDIPVPKQKQVGRGLEI